MLYWKYLDFLPSVPSELVDSYETITKGIEIYQGRPDNGYRAVFLNRKLRVWCINNILPCIFQVDLVQLKNLENDPRIFVYQVLSKKMGVHIDSGRRFTINYVLWSGQKHDHVTTSFYSDLKKSQLLSSNNFDLKRWHYLNSQVPHGISLIDSYRVAITMNHCSLKLRENLGFSA